MMSVVLDGESHGHATMTLTEAGTPRKVSPWSHSRGKRVFDVVVASLAVLLCFPLMTLVAAVVAATSRGPVLFRQKRGGKNGRAIEVLKFRTMSHNPNDSGPGVTRAGDSGCAVRALPSSLQAR